MGAGQATLRSAAPRSGIQLEAVCTRRMYGSNRGGPQSRGTPKDGVEQLHVHISWRGVRTNDDCLQALATAVVLIVSALTLELSFQVNLIWAMHL